MPKKRRWVAKPADHASAASSALPYKQRMNTRVDWDICAQIATALMLMYPNGTVGSTDANLPATLSVQSSLQLYTGGVAQGSITSGGTLSVPKGSRLSTAAMGLTAVSGQTVKINTFADAGTGKLVPNGSYNRPTWGIEHGDAIAPILDGTLADSGTGTDAGYHPIGLSGITATKAFAVVGDSLTNGTGDTYRRGFPIYAGDALGVAVFKGGTDGSNPGGWATSDRSALCGVDFVVMKWSINPINSSADISESPSTFVTGHSTLVASVIKDMHSMGLKVMLCTEGFTGIHPDGAGSPAHARRTATRAAWNDQVRNNGISVLGADAICNLASVLEATENSNTENSTIATAGDNYDVIHWGHTGHGLAGNKLATDITATGWLGEDDTTYTESFRDEFYGAATVGGTDFGRWTQLNVINDKPFLLTGAGFLGTTADATAGRRTPYPTMLIDSSTPSTQGMVEMIGCWADQAGPFEGYGVGFGNSTASVFNGFCGYYAELATNGKFYLFSYGTGARPAISSDVTLPAAGEMYRITLERTNNSGGGVDVTAKLWIGSATTPVATKTLTGDTEAGLGQGTLYPGICWLGDTINNTIAQTNAVDTFIYYDYSPAVPTTATVASTKQVERGGSRPITVLVKDASGLPIVGFPVTASSATTAAATIGASAITDGLGVATFWGANAIISPSSATLGATSVITFTAGTITATCTVTVVSAISGGSSGGEESMTVNSIADYSELTSSWTEVTEVAEGDLVRLTPAGAASPMYYVSDTAPAVTRGVMVPSNGLMLTIPTGKSLYLKAAGPAGAFVEIGS